MTKDDIRSQKKCSAYATFEGDTTVFEGCFKFYFVYYDEKGLLELGKEINRLNNGSFLSFYSVNVGGCKHYLFGNYKENKYGWDQENETEYYLYKFFYNVTLDRSALTDLYEDRIPSGACDSEAEAYEDLLEDGLFDEPWSVSDFELQTDASDFAEYEGSEPITEEPFGCIGFRKPLWTQRYNVPNDLFEIVEQSRRIKKLVQEWAQNALLKAEVSFEGFGYVRYIMCDANMQPTDDYIECAQEKAVYMFGAEEHSIIKMCFDHDTEDITVLSYD